MKKRTLWIIGITTALVTSEALRAAVGPRYGGRDQWREHACWNSKKADDKKSSIQQADSTNVR